MFQATERGGGTDEDTHLAITFDPRTIEKLRSHRWTRKSWPTHFRCVDGMSTVPQGRDNFAMSSAELRHLPSLYWEMRWWLVRGTIILPLHPTSNLVRTIVHSNRKRSQLCKLYHHMCTYLEGAERNMGRFSNVFIHLTTSICHLYT